MVQGSFVHQSSNRIYLLLAFLLPEHIKASVNAHKLHYTCVKVFTDVRVFTYMTFVIFLIIKTVLIGN